MSFFIQSLNDSLKTQTNEIQNALFLSESSIRTDLNETGKVIGKGFVFTKESINILNNKLNEMRGQKLGIGGSYEQQIPVLPAPSFSPVELDMPISATSSTKLIKEETKQKDKNKK